MPDKFSIGHKRDRNPPGTLFGPGDFWLYSFRQGSVEYLEEGIRSDEARTFDSNPSPVAHFSNGLPGGHVYCQPKRPTAPAAINA